MPERDNYELQKRVVDNIAAAVVKNSNHVHLVAHQTKSSELASVSTIAGGAEIGRRANIVLSVERFDKVFLRNYQQLIASDDEFITDLCYKKGKSGQNPDSVISVLKNAKEGALPRIAMTFKRDERRFLNY
jgi:hypothetical protein